MRKGRYKYYFYCMKQKYVRYANKVQSIRFARCAMSSLTTIFGGDWIFLAIAIPTVESYLILQGGSCKLADVFYSNERHAQILKHHEQEEVFSKLLHRFEQLLFPLLFLSFLMHPKYCKIGITMVDHNIGTLLYVCMLIRAILNDADYLTSIKLPQCLSGWATRHRHHGVNMQTLFTIFNTSFGVSSDVCAVWTPPCMSSHRSQYSCFQSCPTLRIRNAFYRILDDWLVQTEWI